MSSLQNISPRAPPSKYKTPQGTRWEKEKAAAGSGAFDFPDDAKFVGPWVIGECVGKGASGHVKIAQHRRTGQLAAVKILPIQPLVNSRASLTTQAKVEKQRLGIDREITMMKLMNHPNVMRIFDVYEGDKELYLILEYVEGGELFDFLVNRGKLPPLEALGYFKQIIYGLNYAHTFSIIHRDLKPENILIHSLNPPLVKIADWGMAAFAPPSLHLETSCGSPHYASPEIVNGHRYTGTATDIWSCGVILYALLTGRLPFDDKNVRILLAKVRSGKYEMPTFIDPLAKDLLSRMLVVDVKQRITMSEILSHPWLQGSTPGITYVPAPPVSELAKPLPSAKHIDKDLFHSLCVIWGRHANIEHIKADLLSPMGEGILAKAFYFLLQKHREKSMEERGIQIDVQEVLNSPGKVVMKQYSTPHSRIRSASHSEPRVRAHPMPVRTARDAQTAPAEIHSPTPSARATKAIQLPPIQLERPHPPSPIGPRPQRPRPASSFMFGENSAHAGPSMLSRDGNKDNHGYITASGGHRTRSESSRHEALLSEFIPARPQRNRQRTDRRQEPPSTSSVIHAPIPIQATPQSVLPMITAPKVDNTDLQRTINQCAMLVNQQAVTWNASQARVYPHASNQDALLTPPENNSAQAQDISKLSRAGDKENISERDETYSRRDNSSHPAPGLGFGNSVNMPSGNATMSKDTGDLWYRGLEKEKGKKKPSVSSLDVSSPVLQKRSTFSIFGSPIATANPSPSILGSPAIGEVKGWFSNLFPWKSQQYLLYSVYDVATTRDEVVRVLESLDIPVSEEHQWGIMRCRVEDLYDGNIIVQKASRFRVEVLPASNQPQILDNTPRLSQQYPSGVMDYMKSRSQFERMTGYEAMISLVLEKGSASTLKTIFQQLKTGWSMDAFCSPRSAVGGVEAVTFSGIEERLAL